MHYIINGPPAFMTGLMIWQDLTKRQQELKILRKTPSPQKMVKKFQVKSLFNPEASAWISQALETHSK